MERIGFVGGGNMAEALIKGVIGAKVYGAENIVVSDIKSERLCYLAEQYGVGTVEGNLQLAEQADIIVLSVKPQNMGEVLAGLKGSIQSDCLVISIAAGVKISDIKAGLGDAAIVRVMPNTPALIGQGVSALFVTDRAKPMLRKAEIVFSSVGKVVFVEDEDLMDAVTAVSGSGPAY